MRGRYRLAGTEAPLRGSPRRAWADRLRGGVVVLATAATVIGLAPAASAAYGSEPVGPSWVPNGGVHAVAVDTAANRVYIGGSFSGGVAALDALTGGLIWQGTADGDVRALALGPNGSLLMGGAFNTVGGATHRKLASVNAATGAVNNTFKGAAGGTVRDIVVVGTDAYFGGAFTSHGGMTQQGLGAVSATTGANVTGFTTPANGSVYALATDGTRLFVGGSFTTLGGLPRNQLGSITLSSTNTVDAFFAPARACTGCTVIWDLTLDNARNRVYTVGRNSGTLFTVNKATGATVYKNVGAINGDSQAVTLAPDGRVYVGGHFVTVQGQTRMLVAEFNVSGATPVLGAFSARFVTSYPGVWAMASTGSRLYVGGDFTVAGNQVNGKRFPYFAIFSDASADTIAPTATVSPADGAADVPASNNVTATFSEAVQGVEGNFALRQAGTTADVPATVTYNATTRVATLDPTATELAAGATYTATLTGGSPVGIRDSAGNPLTTTTSTFTIAPPPDKTPPTLASTDPATGASAALVTTTVTATFSELVSGVSGGTFTLADAAGAPVDASVTRGAGNAWVLDPTVDLTAGATYTAALASSGITDGAGNVFGGQSWSFTTATATAPTDTTAPTWTGRIPSKDGATGVSRTANVTVAFDEQVQNVETSFTLTPAAGGTPVAATVTYNSTSGRWVLNPNASLLGTTQYRAEVTKDVTDLAGNPFAGMTWTFTTAL